MFGDGECYDGEWEDGKIVRGIWYSNYHHYQLQDDPEAAKFYNNPSITKKIKIMSQLEEKDNGKKRKRKDSEPLPEIGLRFIYPFLFFTDLLFEKFFLLFLFVLF